MASPSPCQTGSTGKQGKVEKATSSVEVPSEEPESEGAKDVAEDPPSEGQNEVPADDDEPLVGQIIST